MLPDFIRYFADTSDSPHGRIALKWCKSLCRVAPVRVVSLAAGMDGGWKNFDELLLTPMVGSYVNCVCLHPQHWEYTQQVPVADRAFAALEHHVHDGKTSEEVLTGRVELRTAGVRNVLFLTTLQLAKAYVEIAKRYDAIVCATEADVWWWHAEQKKPPAVYLAQPGIDHDAVRAAVLGEP